MVLFDLNDFFRGRVSKFSYIGLSFWIWGYSLVWDIGLFVLVSVEGFGFFRRCV